MMALGAVGLMNAVGNLNPRVLAEMCDAVWSGDLGRGREMHERLLEVNKAVFYDTNPIPIKYMMKRLGILSRNEHRLPMVPATPELERKLDLRSGAGRTARPDRQDGVRLAEFEGQRFAPPVALHGKIFCIGVNYGDRNAEYKDGSDQPKYPSVFMRTPGSLVGDGEKILRPPESEQLDYEGEIVLVIGKRGRRIPRESAHAHIGGLDVRERRQRSRLDAPRQVQCHAGQEFRTLGRDRADTRDGR